MIVSGDLDQTETSVLETADLCHLTNLKKYQSFLKKKPQNKEEFK